MQINTLKQMYTNVMKLIFAYVADEDEFKLNVSRKFETNQVNNDCQRVVAICI